MAATILNSPKAFVRLRQLVQANPDLARKLAALERYVARLDTTTRTQFHDVYAAIKALVAQPSAKRRPTDCNCLLANGSGSGSTQQQQR